MKKVPSLSTRFAIAICLLSLGLSPAWAEKKSPTSGKHQLADPAGIQRLKNSIPGSVVSTSDATGTVTFVRFAPGTKGDLMKSSGKKPAKEKTDDFLQAYGSIFGLQNPKADLQLREERTDLQGGRHLSYGQAYNGVPVFAGVLKAHFDAEGNLVGVNGNVIPEIDLSPFPTKSSQSAAAAALAEVSADNQGSGALSAMSTNLVIYRTGLAKGVDGDNYLAWEIEVGNGFSVREFVYVDAHTAEVIDRLPGIYDAMNRRAYDGNFSTSSVPPSYPGTPFWVEGQPFPTGNPEADNMITSSKETYDFYKTSFNRDSFNGSGGTMDAIFNRGNSCPNASWNGTFISFCNGLTVDDVTSHEWSHAYTQYTHNLIYQWQPGALNEAYSDIFGETVDRINGRDHIGDSANDPPRTGQCSSYTPPRGQLIVNAPASLAGSYPTQTANFGPSLSATGPITAAVVLALDGANASGSLTTDACTAITNAADVAGKIALVERGTCNFSVKVYNAQVAGAIAVLVYNNVTTGLPGMGAGINAELVTIPSLGITQATGQSIIASSGVNATLRSTSSASDPSTRWLLGEDSTAVGLTGALRDMYNPNCYSNPGKITDTAYYVCGPGTSANDNGGVHTNSGIPNHAYALLVDGGTYNGQTINAIGLTKAAHIYFRAMSVYQSAASAFPDHADAIEQSATDLIGVNLTDLVSGGPSGQIITLDDVLQVQKVMVAVEMRTPPTQCNFTPLLAKNTPALPVCPAQSVRRTVYGDNFEGATDGWSIGRLSTAATFTSRDWSLSSTVPSRAGKAFWAPDPNISTCSGPPDESGVLTLSSPVITLPAALSNKPMLAFDQYVATEAGWDGGQLWYSVDGGTFALMPQAAFSFNLPNVVLSSAAQGNTNPRRSQRAWSGTDAGGFSGSWGTSIVNFNNAGAPAVSQGQTIQFRFDLSTDACGGNPRADGGWWLDEVKLLSCEPDADEDGIRDADDLCPGTSLTPIVLVGSSKFSNTGVPNNLFQTGCTMQQMIDACSISNKNRGSYVSCVSDLTDGWVLDGTITSAQKDAIMRAAGQVK